MPYILSFPRKRLRKLKNDLIKLQSVINFRTIDVLHETFDQLFLVKKVYMGKKKEK